MPKKKNLSAAVQSANNLTYSGSLELLESEVGLVGYNTDIVRKLSKHLKLPSRNMDSERGKILEFGAGTGSLAEIFRDKFDLTPDCLEIDPKLIEIIRKKGFLCFRSFAELPQKYEAIYTSNVLEHIENDADTLHSLYAALLPGGRIGIYVPACPTLFSSLDIHVGHFRRYRRRELIQKVEKSGFEVKSVCYVDFIGYFASLAVKVLGFKSATNLGSVASLKFYDGVVYPLSRVFDFLGLRFLLGKNLLIIAEKKG